MKQRERERQGTEEDAAAAVAGGWRSAAAGGRGRPGVRVTRRDRDRFLEAGAIEKGDIARSVVATGKIQPLVKVEVKSKASGIVKEILVDYGDSGEQGPGAGRTGQGRAAGPACGRQRGRRCSRPGQPSSAREVEARRPRPSVPEIRGLERARTLYEEGLISTSRARGRGEGVPARAQQAGRGRVCDRGREPGRGRRTGAGRRSSGRRRTCGTRRSSAPWTASSSRATSRWATRSAPSWSSAPRPRWS